MSPIDTYNFKPSFIKIDAEGSEVEILKGSFNTLKMYKPFLQIENDTVLENNPIIDSMLFDLGYKKMIHHLNESTEVNFKELMRMKIYGNR